MKYFKDVNNNLYAYEADGSQDEYIKPGLTAITLSEAVELSSNNVSVPQEVSIFQAEESLAHFGYLPVVEMIMASPQTPDKYKRAWRRVGSVRRDSEVMAGIAAILGLSDAQVDELFIYAAGVTA